MKEYILGADIGTEGTKVVLVNRDGAVVKTAYDSYHYDIPAAGWTEQDPVVWWLSFVKCIQNILSSGIEPKCIAGIGMTGQMHSPVLFDVSGRVLRKSILWNDLRTSNICHELTVTGLAHKHDNSCTGILPGFTSASLLWLRSNEPDIFQRIHRIMLPKDYINFCLTGRFTTDSSDASGTGVFSLIHNSWNTKLMTELGLNPEWFPSIVDSANIIGEVTQGAAQAIGLEAGTPVVCGAADNAASMVGTGALKPGQGVVTIGTSGSIVAPLKAGTDTQTSLRLVGEEMTGYLKDLPLHVYAHAIPEMWIAAGCSLSAGSSLRWFRDEFGSGRSYDEVLQQVRSVPPGSEGVFFLPQLTGNRSVARHNPLRGAFLGLGLQHTRNHLARAVIEGVSFSLRDALELVQTHLQTTFDSLVLTGGILNSDSWPQILCDVLGVPLRAAMNYQGAAYGAALLIGQALNLWQLDTHSFEAHNSIAFVPRENTRQYNSVYGEYRQMIDRLYYS